VVVVAALLAALLASCSGTADRAGTPSATTGAGAPVAAVAGTTWYVAPSGDDGATGTERTPWRTLGHALAQLTPGDRLYVRGGTYHERITDVALRPGLSGRPILVTAYPHERAVLAGLLWLRSPSYWVFDGLDVTWDDAIGLHDEHMVRIIDGRGWTWTNSEIAGARSFAGMLVAGDKPGEPADWSITNNCIHDTAATNDANEDHNLYIGDMDAAGPGLVERNIIFGAPNGHNIKLGAGDLSGGPTNVVVRYNTLYGAAVPLILSGRASDVIVERNILGGSARGFLVRAFELTGTGDVVRDNVGFDAGTFFADESPALGDGGGNVLVDPGIERIGECDGFRPALSDTALASYGRYATGAE
jgi:hypothetical protein